VFKKLLNHKLFTTGFWYIVLTFLSGVVGFLFHFLTSRKLSVGGYGELQSLTAVYTIFGVLSVAVPNFAVKYSSVIARAGDKAAGKQFMDWLNGKMRYVSLFVLAGLVLISPLLKYYLRLPDLIGLLLVGLAIFITTASAGYSGVLTGWGKFIPAGAAMLFSMFTKLLSAFLIVMFTRSASLVSAVYLISVLAIWWAYIFFSKKIFAGVAGGDSVQINWREKYFPGVNIRKSVFPVFMFSLMIISLQYMDIMAVKNVSSSELTGHYGALKMLGVVILTINLAIVALFLPEACAAGHSGKCVSKKTLGLVYGALFAINIPSILFYYLFPDFTISLLFGAKYVLYAGDLWLFGLAAFFFALLNLEANFAYGRHDYRISYVLVAVAFLMTGGIYFFHATFREMILSVNMAFLGGYLTALVINQSANWWVGSPYLTPFVFIFGLLIVRKIQREDLVFSFAFIIVKYSWLCSFNCGGCGRCSRRLRGK